MTLQPARYAPARSWLDQAIDMLALAIYNTRRRWAEHADRAEFYEHLERLR